MYCLKLIRLIVLNFKFLIWNQTKQKIAPNWEDNKVNKQFDLRCKSGVENIILNDLR